MQSFKQSTPTVKVIINDGDHSTTATTCSLM